MRLAANWQPLRNAWQFDAVMQAGQVLARSPHFVVHALRWQCEDAQTAASSASGAVTTGDGRHSAQARLMRRTALFPAKGQTYLGTIVPKRWARRAVTRNLIKRQIRHVMVNQLPTPLSDMAVVVRQRAAFDSRQFVSARSDALRLAVRQELLDLAQRPDWTALSVRPALFLRQHCMASGSTRRLPATAAQSVRQSPVPARGQA